MSAVQDGGKTTLRIRPPELRARLDEQAALHKRSLNNLILWILEQWLDENAPVQKVPEGDSDGRGDA